MVPTRRPSIALLATLTLAAAPAVAVAGGGKGSGHSGPDKHHGGGQTTPAPAPATIALPGGYQPEGIASGPGGQLYVGSIPTGAVLRADPRTGATAIVVPGRTGRAAIGLKVDRDRIFVAGGPTGRAFIYDVRTGADIADLTLTTRTTFVNDVTLTKDAAYFTDSQQPNIYRVSTPKSRGGKKGKPSSAAYTSQTIKITGDLVYDSDPATFEANGIAALPGGKELLVVQSGTGKLFRVNSTTGVSVQVPISGGDLVNGDGLLLKGDTLYVVQNRLNRIAVVQLSDGATSGTIERTITNPAFRVPTTIARQRGDLFVVNARFGTPATPTTDYDIVRVSE